MIYAFQLFLYSGIIFFKIIIKAPNNHHSFIYVIIIIIIIIIIISLLLVFELNDKLTYSKLFLQSSRYQSFQ